LNPALRSVGKKCFRRFLQTQDELKSRYVDMLTIGYELRTLLSAWGLASKRTRISKRTDWMEWK